MEGIKFMDKKKSMKIALSTTIAASAFVAANPGATSAASVSETAELVKKAQAASSILKPYYTTNAADEVNGISGDFWAKYNASVKSIKEAQSAVNTLSGNDKTTWQAHLDAANEYRMQAARFIDSVKVGKELNDAKDKLVDRIESGEVITEEFAADYHAVSAAIRKAERVMSKAYGGDYRTLLLETYVTPAKISKETVIYEVSRYELQKKVDADLEAGELEAAAEKIAMLERLEERAVEIKRDGNILHPGMYPDLPEIEEALDTVTQELVERYESTQTPAVESVSAINADKEVTVTFAKDVTAEMLADATLTLTPAEGDAATATLKEDSVAGMTAVFTVDGELAEGEYTVTSEMLEIAEDTMVVYDVTAPVVDSSEVADYQTLQLNLSEAVTGTPVVTVNGEEMAGVLSEDGKTVTVKNETGYKAGTYNVVLSGLADGVGNEIAETTVSITKAASYAKTFEQVTSDVTAGLGELVYFSAVDQYGQDMALTADNSEIAVSAKVNGVPLKASEIVYSDGDAFVEINKTLAEGNTLSVTVTNTVEEEEFSNTFSYTVLEDATLVETTVSDLEATYNASANGHTAGDVATEVRPDDEITLSVDVRDQFNNPVAAPSVRWVVEEGKDLIAADGDDLTSGVLDADNTVEFKATDAGTVKITAYLANGESVSYMVEVGAKALSSLSYDGAEPIPATTYNQDEIVVKEIVQNDGAVLTPEMLNFNVTAEVTTDETVTADDVTVTAKLRSEVEEDPAEGTENDILIVVQSSKVGKFNVTPYVGESILDEDAIKAPQFTVTTTIDQTVTSIDGIDFDASELKVGQEVKKEVVFRNKHDEVVVVDAANVTTTPSLTTAEVIKEDSKNYLVLEASAEKSYQVTVSNGDVFKSYTLSFVDADLTTIDAGADITGVVAGDGSEFTKYQELGFLDQDGKEMTLSPSDLGEVVVTDSEGTELTDSTDLITLAESFTKDEDGVITDYSPVGIDSTTVVGYAVSPDSSLAEGTYTVEIQSADGKVSDTFTVEVGAIREIAELNSNASSVKLAVDGSKLVTISPEDQYGVFKSFDPVNDIDAVSANNNVSVQYVGDATNDDGEVIGYQYEITGQTKGSDQVTFTYNDNDPNTEDTIKTAVNVTVDSTGALIDSVEVNEEDLNELYSTTDGETINLSASAFDASGNEVAVNASDYVWSVVSVDPSDDNAEGAKADVNSGGVLTADQDFDGTVTVKVQSSNLKEDTVTLEFSSDAAAPVMGTTAIAEADTLDADEDLEGIQVALDGDDTDGEVNGSVSFTLEAMDQFGNELTSDAIDETDAIVTTDDSSVLSVDVVDGAITVTGVNKGDANVYVQYNGDTITLNFSVDENGVEADITPPSAPTVEPVTSTDTTVTGTAEAGSTVTVYEGTTVLGEAVAAEDGSYSVTITAQPADVVLKVTATDDSSNESAGTDVTVS
ncbi:Ig-like domain-containing protein [Pseudalkalibacillus sp. R45]|uniref:Ig-like domain-containing protein n=1 Tax=Pseudalkalibacillus sp. R45 TaxID=3457433 RepID=UPI003FCC38AF